MNTVCRQLHDSLGTYMFFLLSKWQTAQRSQKGYKVKIRLFPRSCPGCIAGHQHMFWMLFASMASHQTSQLAYLERVSWSTTITKKAILIDHSDSLHFAVFYLALLWVCVFLSLTCGLSLRHVSRQGQSMKGSFIQGNTVAGQHDCWQSGCSESVGRRSPGSCPVKSLCMDLSSHLIPIHQLTKFHK